MEGFPTGSSSDIIVRLSTASLTSSSSSGSESRKKDNVCMTDSPTTQLLMNGGNDCLVNSSSPKPSTSTGAIPKSISFDMTAERGDKELLDDDQKNKRGFFGKLKMSLKNRRGKSLRGTEDLNRCYDREAGGDGADIGRHRVRRIMSEDSSACGTAHNG